MEKMQEIEEEDRSYVIHKYIQKLRESKSTCSDCNRMFYTFWPFKRRFIYGILAKAKIHNIKKAVYRSKVTVA